MKQFLLQHNGTLHDVHQKLDNGGLCSVFNNKYLHNIHEYLSSFHSTKWLPVVNLSLGGWELAVI